MNRIEITRYGSRNWAVWLDGELLVVAVYKKGAMAVAQALTSILTSIEKDAHHATLAS